MSSETKSFFFFFFFFFFCYSQIECGAPNRDGIQLFDKVILNEILRCFAEYNTS